VREFSLAAQRPESGSTEPPQLHVEPATHHAHARAPRGRSKSSGACSRHAILLIHGLRVWDISLCLWNCSACAVQTHEVAGACPARWRATRTLTQAARVLTGCCGSVCATRLCTHLCAPARVHARLILLPEASGVLKITATLQLLGIMVVSHQAMSTPPSPASCRYLSASPCATTHSAAACTYVPPGTASLLILKHD
jgi:hypothetical protein